MSTCMKDFYDHVLVKKRSNCGIVKLMINFHNHESFRNGLQSTCKDCRKNFYNENQEKIKKYLLDNRERTKQYYLNVPDRIKEYQMIFFKKTSLKKIFFYVIEIRMMLIFG